MKLISNTGPIIALAKVKKLAWLKELALDVVISVAVYRELFAKISEESKVIEKANVLRDRAPKDFKEETMITGLMGTARK